MIRVIFAFLLLIVAVPAAAQTSLAAPPAPASVIDPATWARVAELTGMIAGRGDYKSYFSPAFRTALSKDKWHVEVARITALAGKPIELESTFVFNPWQGIVRLRCERGIAFFEIAVDPKAPHQVIGLLFVRIDPLSATSIK